MHTQHKMAISTTSFNVKYYGASGTGYSLDTDAIQTAIKACSENGGGIVYFPPGTYLTGTIHLQSNVHIYLEAGATILGSDDLRDYHKPKHLTFGCTDMDSYRVNQLIYGRKLENVSITGGGTINCRATSFFAQGEEAKSLAKSRGTPWKSTYGPKKWRPRSTLHLFCCRNVLIEGVTFTENAVSAIQIVGCSIVNIHRIVIDNDLKWILTDGIEIHASNNVNICDSVITVWDDPIAIYQGISNELEEPLEGDELEKHPNEFITIRNCVMNTVCNLRINGGNGGRINNVLFDNVIYNGCYGGGYPVNIQNWHTGQWGDCGEETADDVFEQTTDIENIHFNNFTVNGASWLFRIDGEDHVGKTALGKAGMGNFRNISFSNCEFHIVNYGYIAGDNDLKIQDVRFTDVRIHLENRSYNDSNAYRYSELAYPFEHLLNIQRTGITHRHPIFPQTIYCRHVNGLLFRNIEVTHEKDTSGDWCGALRCDDVSNLRLENVSIGKFSNKNTEEVAVSLNNVNSAVIQSCFAKEETEVFLEVAGDKTRNISLLANDLSQARIAYRTTDDVKEGSLRTQSNLL